MAAQCRSSKCTVERKGLRRELDSWRNKLLHCVGFESILEGVCGPFLLRDLNIFNNCEPVEMGDWSLEATCSFCNLLINDHVMVATSPLPSPSDATPSPSDATPIHAPVISESSLSAHRFLHSVFHETELEVTGDTTIPQVAQELMRRMVKQFAIEYASKTHLTTSSPTGLKRSDLEIPLDLTVARNQENQEEEPTPVGGVLDLSKRNSDSSAISSPANHKSSGRQQEQRWATDRVGVSHTEHHAERSSELSEALLSKALRDVRSGCLEENRAALLYGIPQETLRSQLEVLTSLQGDVGRCPARGGEVRLMLQKVAAWAELGERGENREMRFLHSSSSSCLTQHGLHMALSLSLPQLREELHLLPPTSPPSVPLRIPQVRSFLPPHLPDPNGLVKTVHYLHPPHDGSTAAGVDSSSSSLLKLHRSLLPSLDLPDLPPHHPVHRRSSSLDDSEGAEQCEDNKQPRKKRGRYRQYDHDLLEEAITMVMDGRMSVSKAQVVYGIPHSTLEYKVKERNGTLKITPKRRPVITTSSSCSANADNKQVLDY
ncbi:hypothetical protein DPEC_G00180240 [Dallia pectoralis]|uniref:Uncharacterized protein n=1 Tax=Dallia pectoralis TaxID=75939 RepID=A0ACC2G9U3_DALPE|nr:hypothetical protein DPEC_G00180240 [Dallia pectoralis]